MTWRQVHAVGAGLLLAALFVLSPAVAIRAVENGPITPLWWDCAVVVVLLTCAGGLGSCFAGSRDPRWWAGLLALVTGVGIVTFPWVARGQLVLGEQPWLALVMPVAAAALGVALRWVPALFGGLVLAGSQVVAQFGGPWPRTSHQLAVDAVYVVVCTMAAAAAIEALRLQAASIDSAEDRAIAASARAGSLDAQRQEAARWDAYIHDEVLATLETARSGYADPADVRRLAREALAGFDRVVGAGRPTTRELVEHLTSALDATIVVRADPDRRVPGEIVAAVTAATTEAWRNARRHTPAGTSVEVTLQMASDGLTVRVRDDGPGFDPDRVPRSCMGISVSIVGRMRAVGGDAWVRAGSDVGTTVTLRCPDELL